MFVTFHLYYSFECILDNAVWHFLQAKKLQTTLCQPSPLDQWPYAQWGRSIQFWNEIWIFLEYLAKPFSTSLLCPF